MDKASKHCEKMAAKIKQQAEKLEKMRKREEVRILDPNVVEL